MRADKDVNVSDGGKLGFSVTSKAITASVNVCIGKKSVSHLTDIQLITYQHFLFLIVLTTIDVVDASKVITGCKVVKKVVKKLPMGRIWAEDSLRR